MFDKQHASSCNNRDIEDHFSSKVKQTEMTQAATKIQANFRRVQAKKKVDAIKQQRDLNSGNKRFTTLNMSGIEMTLSANLVQS